MDGVDIIVVNYRTPDDLQNFLDSVVEFDGSKHTMWIVNVQPDEKSLVVANEYNSKNPYTYHLVSDQNIGYARSVNWAGDLGFRSTLAVFNADVIINDGTIERCVEALYSHDDWGVLGPGQVNQQNRVTAAGIFGPREAPAHRAWQRNWSTEFEDVRDDCPTVAGSAMFIRRQTWQELSDCPRYKQAVRWVFEDFWEENPEYIGCFLPTQLWYEETFMCYHAIEHGWKNVYYGKEKIVHKWHSASPQQGFADRWIPESRRIFRHCCDMMGIPRD